MVYGHVYVIPWMNMVYSNTGKNLEMYMADNISHTCIFINFSKFKYCVGNASYMSSEIP